VPRISVFHGIVIRMYFDEHGVPHFHAYYSGHEASIAIDSLDVLEGSLPRARLRLVRKWAALHRAELLSNWERSRRELPPKPIEPLP
jgi:hypothetical protein